MELLYYTAMAVVATAVVWKASDWLESSSEALAAYYQLSAIVQGAVIAALGSSFPELASTVLATLLHGEFDLGVSVIIGSAVFNILVIPGVSGLVGKTLVSDRELVYKDAQFYITSVAVLLVVFSIAVIYNPVEGESLTGMVTRPIAIIPLLLYGLYLFLHQQDMMEYEAEPPSEDIAVRRQWLLLAASLVVIFVGAEGLVRAAIGFGDYFGTPSFLWGFTVVAAGTGLPDAFVSIRAAQKGEGTVSVANVLGSNIFNLLVVVPVGVIVAGAASIDYAVAAPMMGVLTLATIVLFAMLRTQLTLTRTECVVLLALYAIFIGWMVLETVGVTAVVS